ncbi:MAG TPA: AAC(3) family N-acetyltransferase [Stellaceae bacterium]|nr:AAC(3) family N-acetyltransferase [Stellaceae bacterium]
MNATAPLGPEHVVAALGACGIGSGDLLMLHSDALVAAQFRSIPEEQRLDLVLDSVLAALGPSGTLVVPTFTYSFTKGEVFDLDYSPSTVGQLTERFRLRPGVLRSHHPLFSVAAHGALADAFAASTTGDCFGPGTAFDLLYRHGGKIACLGCGFDRITFVHYVEQCAHVDYRYNKRFDGLIRRDGVEVASSVSYLVRDLARDTPCDLGRLKRRLQDAGKLRSAAVGRVGLLAVTAHDFFETANALLAEEPAALIREGAGRP